MQTLSAVKSKKVLLVFDKFKDTLTSSQICKTVRGSISQHFKNHQSSIDIEIEEVPISDGGDGFLDCMYQLFKESYEGQEAFQHTKVLDPLLRELDTRYLLDYEHSSAFIEVANTSGLQLLTKEERNPFVASSIGTGQLMKYCFNRGYTKRIYIGCGGSAFVDGGLGAIQALEIFDFIDKKGKIMNQKLTLKDIGDIDHLKLVNTKIIEELDIVMPCDVQNTLTGENGAAFVFGPQKGAKPEDLQIIDDSLEKIMKLYLQGIHQQNYSQSLYETLAQTKGTGACGGLVAALLACFKNARIVNGMDYISGIMNLDGLIQNSDVVFTGEGSFDTQTLEGKVVSKIHNFCILYSKPLVVICGINKLTPSDMLTLQKQNPNLHVFDLVSTYGLDRSLKDTAKCLQDLTDNTINKHIERYLI